MLKHLNEEHFKLDYRNKSRLIRTDKNKNLTTYQQLMHSIIDKVQMIYFQETACINYSCSARSDTENVVTLRITRDTDT